MRTVSSTAVSESVQADLFEAALEIGRLLASADDREQVLDAVARSLGMALRARQVVIALFVEGDERLIIEGLATNGDLSPLAVGMTIPARRLGVGDEAAWRMVMTGLPAGGLFPIVGAGRVRGVLAVIPAQAGAVLTSAEARLCQSVAEQIGAALAAAQARSGYERRLAQLAAQANLVQMVLEGRGLVALTAALADLLGNPITVADSVFHLLAYSPDQERTDRHRQESIVAGGTPRVVLDDPNVRRQFHQVALLREPLALANFPEHGWVQRRIQAPILMGNDVLGRVTVVEANRPFVETDSTVLREATVALALELMKQRAALETEHRLRADFLRDLLAGPIDDRTAIIARAGYLGIDLLRPWDLLVVEVDGVGGFALDYEEADPGVAKRRIFETIRHIATRSCAQSVVVGHGESILVLVPTTAKVASSIRSLADTIRREITRVSLRATISVGIGPTCYRLEDFAQSYAQAKRALDVVRSLGQSNTVTSLDDLGIYGMLFRSDDCGELIRFADRMLGPLLEYDRKHGTALVETLDAYFEENGNHRRTAGRLFIHINTLAGRLERIATIANVDLDDATTRLNLQLALRILRLTGQVPPRAGTSASTDPAHHPRTAR